MTQATLEPPAIRAVPKRSLLSLWPYVVLLLVLGGAGYSFYRLCQPPAGVPMGYAAIAYSPSTGEFGTATDCAELDEAERLALARCPHPDSKIVVWSHGEFCALAVAKDKSFGIGSGKSLAAAENAALEHCRARTKSECRVAVCLSPKGGVGEPEAAEPTGNFVAIAYSRSTGEYGAAHECATLAQAERMAKRLCQSADAEIVTWAHGKWCALAVAEDRAFGYAWAATRAEAEKNALYQCSRYARTPYNLVAVVSGGSEHLEESFVVHPGSGPNVSISLPRFPKVGAKLAVTRDERVFFSFETTASNSGEAMANEEDVTAKRSTITVLEGGESRPAKYLIAFDQAQRTKDGKKETESIQGRTATYTWDGEKYELKFDGPVSDKDRKDLERDANVPHLETLLSPGRPVKVGETWSIPAEQLARTTGPAIKLDQAGTRAVGRLIRVYEQDGKRRGVLQLTCDLSILSLGAMKFDPPIPGSLEGELDAVIDGSSSDSVFTQSARIQGSAQVVTGTGRRWGQLEMTYSSREQRAPAK